jgi:hypothetical protein
LDSIDYYPLATQYFDLAPPTNISAELSGSSSENVTISWNASPEDPVNVTKYAIYYNKSYDDFGRDYKFLAEVPATGAVKYYLNIIGIGEGDPDNYFFFVQANNSKVFRFSRSDEQAAKYTRNLTAGKQLISIPLILNNTSISTSISSVLQTVKYDIAWHYDNSDQIDPWKSYNPSKPFNDLTSVNHTMALWLVINEDCNLTAAETTDIQLKQGWNFVGYPSLFERIVWDALNGVNYQHIVGYFLRPPEYLITYSLLSSLMPGYGYWIEMAQDAAWTVEN